MLTFIPIKKANSDVEGIFLIVQDITIHKQLEQSIELKERHLAHAQEIAKIGSWEYLIEEDKLFCSDSFYDLFGMKKKSRQPKLEEAMEYVHPDDIAKTEKVIKHAITTGFGYAIDFRIYREKEELRYFKIQAEVIWEHNKPYKIIGVVKDITTQTLAESRFEDSHRKFRSVFDNFTVGIWIKDFTSNKLTYVSKGVESIMQYPVDELLTLNNIWENMIHPDDKKEVTNRQKQLENGKTLVHRYRIICGDGTTKWVFDQTTPWLDDEGKLVNLVGMLTDITPEVEMNDQLEYFASHDTLTGLPNQRSLYNKLDELCTKNPKAKFALFYLDLDRFKIINDSLGYQIGDKVLKQTAEKLLSVLPENGYLSRISSNDFVALVGDYPSKSSIFDLAEKIIETVENPLMVNGYELNITTSVGISFFPDDGNNKLTLIENAHAALYHAKQLGKNNFQLYSFSRGISSYKKYMLEKDMRKAIVNEDFEVYYQPKVHPDTGVIQGAEALIRWNHEEWGLVYPGEFIPLAEENHLINQIGDWVIREVCAQLHTWKCAGYSLRPVSINLSPLRFMRKGLVELIEKQLKQYNLPAKFLEFEITESSLLKNEKTVLSTLAGLKKLGVRIAIDDFGTGYASLSYLREFHADTIKIDQVFIKNIQAEDKKDAAIISSILHLAKGLEMKVVAEGVEEYEQLQFLKQKECDEIQGFLFSKPVPVGEFEQMLEIGYIKPTKPKINNAQNDERRNFYRVNFPHHVLGEMSIIEVNKRKVNLGAAQVLIEDIGLGGIKILSTLKLPINSSIKFKFSVKLLGEIFKFYGDLVWKDEVKDDTFYYGINFNINKSEEDQLASVINKITVLQKLNQELPNTPFIRENPYVYLNKHQL